MLIFRVLCLEASVPNRGKGCEVNNANLVLFCFLDDLDLHFPPFSVGVADKLFRSGDPDDVDVMVAFDGSTSMLDGKYPVLQVSPSSSLESAAAILPPRGVIVR